MRAGASTTLLLASAAVVACGSDLPADQVASGHWASDSAVLAVSDTGTVLLITNAQQCYGSFVITTAPIAAGNFSVNGTFTQLTNLFPGHVDYAAVLSGTYAPGRLSIAVTVAALQRTFGPFAMEPGDGDSTSACRYP